MATYASPKALKWTLLVINTFIFFISVVLFMMALVDFIGYESVTISETGDEDDSLDTHHHRHVFPHKLNDDDDDDTDSLLVVNRFPSIGSAPVKFILVCVTMGVAINGIVASNGEHSRLLNINGYLCFLSFFLKYLFIFVSIRMAGLSRSFQPIGPITIPLYLGIGLFELILGMSSCQFSSILKRGDAAEPRIEKLPLS